MPDNTYDRYVTWAMEVPEGVVVPRLDRWSLPVWFPDDSFYPRNIVPMYAIRNPADATVWSEDDSQQITVPAGYWFCYTYQNNFVSVSDDYFWGSIPDLSGGTVFPPDATRDPGPVNPPPWVGDPTPPGTGDATPTDIGAVVSDPPAATPEETQP